MSAAVDDRARVPGLTLDPGIDPVPRQHRTLSALDLAVLWGDLGIGLLVLVTGALLVPALGFSSAMAAILLGSLIGVTLLALVGAAGADRGLPSMVLLRSVLGVRGSWLPSALNALQMVGWTAVELWAMSFVADLVARRSFGISARPLWLAVAAVVCTGLALWGPVGVTRVWMERFGAWLIGGISVAVTVLLVAEGALEEALASSGAGGFPTFGPALDLVIAMPISWLPAVADYSRFATRPRAAFVGTFSGYFVANVWLYALGALLVLSAGADPSPAGVAGGILAVVGGSIAGGMFLLGLLVGETDEAFANIYSASVTLQNIFPRLPQRILSLAVAALGTALAAWLTMERYESFLFLIGSVFVPLFGVFIAVYFASPRRGTGRPVWEGASGVRLTAVVAWLAGFLVYHWILPTGPGWWTGFVVAIVGDPLSERFVWLGASVPSLVVSGLLALAALRLSSRRRLDRPAGDRRSSGAQ